MTVRATRRNLLGPLFALTVASPLAAQMETRLAPQAASAYRQYLHGVETQLEARWKGKRPALAIDEHPGDLAKVHQGDYVIHPAAASSPASIPDAQIHDWVGAMWLPGVTIDAALAAIGDADHHKEYHPEFLESHLVSRNGNVTVSHWRVKRTKIITVVLDVDLTSEFLRFPNGVAAVRTHATRVSEVQHPGTPEEKVLPPGVGNGFLWRLDAYWTLRQLADGVLAECRSVSLSRAIPHVLAWIITPMTESVPRESLLSTLRGTRLMIERRAVRN